RLYRSKAARAEEIAGHDVERVGIAEVEHTRIHHRLHRAERRDDQPLQRGPRLVAAHVVERGGIERQRAIARAHEHVEETRQRRLALAPDDARPARSRVDLDVVYAGLGRQRPLDAAHAAGAAHAVDEQQRLAAASAEVANRVTRDLGTCPDSMAVVRCDLGAHRDSSACVAGTLSNRSPTPGSAPSGWASASMIVTMQPAIDAANSAIASHTTGCR